jgi:hypothetical protein
MWTGAMAIYFKSDKIQKGLSQNSQSLGQDSNLGPRVFEGIPPVLSNLVAEINEAVSKETVKMRTSEK